MHLTRMLSLKYSKLNYTLWDNWQSCSTEARCGTDDNGRQKDHYIRIMAGEKTWQSQTELKTLRDVNSREDFLRASRICDVTAHLLSECQQFVTTRHGPDFTIELLQ